MDALFQRMDTAARNLFPLGLAFASVILGAVPLYLPGYGMVAPDFALMVVFYWSIYRPELFPAAVAFAVGLVQDALMGTPIGLNALVLLCVYGIIVAQRRFFHRKSFLVVWWAFSIVALGAGVLGWMVMAGLNLHLVDPLPGLFASLLTIALYPFVTWLLARIHHAVLPDGPNVPR